MFNVRTLEKAVLLVYDTTNLASFGNLSDWADLVATRFANSPKWEIVCCWALYQALPTTGAAVAVLVNTVACVLLQLCQGSYHCGQTAHPLASTVAHNHHTSHRRPHVAVVGNKRDLSHLRVVSQSAHEGFAKSHGASVYLVSAKSGDGVAMMFRSVVASITGIRVCGASLSCIRQGVNAACKKSTNVAQPSCIFLLHTVSHPHLASHHQATMTSTATQVALRLMAAWTQWLKPQTQTQTAQVTKAEAERLSAVMTADVVDHADAPPRAVKHKKPAKKSNKGSTKSGICAVQWQQPPAHNCIEIRG
jgi:hypothetical protein